MPNPNITIFFDKSIVQKKIINFKVIFLMFNIEEALNFYNFFLPFSMLFDVI